MGGDAHDVGGQTILRKYAKGRADTPLEMTTDEKVFMTHAKTVNRQRQQDMNLMWYDEKISIFTVVKKKTEMCEYKLHTGSDGNLMPMRTYTMLFLQTNID